MSNSSAAAAESVLSTSGGVEREVSASSSSSPSALQRTMNSKGTLVRSGNLVCIPFATSSKPFVTEHTPAEVYGMTHQSQGGGLFARVCDHSDCGNDKRDADAHDPRSSSPLFSIISGKHNTIMNPPNKDRTTTVRRTHNKTAVTVQSAGSLHKMPVPFSPMAFRNRVRNDMKRLPPPFKSTLSFDMGVVNKPLHPFRTINSVTQEPSKEPLHTRVGFTNDHIRSEIAKRLHKPLYAS